LWSFVAAMLGRTTLEPLWVFAGDDARRAVLCRALAERAGQLGWIRVRPPRPSATKTVKSRKYTFLIRCAYDSEIFIALCGGERMRYLTRLLSLSAFVLACLASCYAQEMPAHIGDCVSTKIKVVGTRLVGESDSGSVVSFENGGYQVSYDRVPEVENSIKGDSVRMCLVSLPKNCPKGDSRGRVYRTTNLRTHQSWTLPDSEHECGGA
jgi:hypothetical protein